MQIVLEFLATDKENFSFSGAGAEYSVLENAGPDS
jgi:hypothetical protein